jgi:acetyltransferase-like isoleucine patch superfamily enzyme
MLRLRGAKVVGRTRIDRHCYFENPTGIAAGSRIHIEQNVTVKIVSASGQVDFGEGVFIGRNTTLDIIDHLKVGARSLIAPGCFITDHNHSIAPAQRIVDQGVNSRRVEIGEDAWIGANVCILPGVKVGDGAVIGAGAVVTRDVPSNCVAVGVPAQILKERSAPKS